MGDKSTNRVCIVSRDHPSLYGYLCVVYEREMLGPGRFDLLVDRRRPTAGRETAEAGTPVPERRRYRIGQELTVRGFAIVDLDQEPDTTRILPDLAPARARTGSGLAAQFYRWRRPAAAVALSALGVGGLVGLAAAGGPRQVITTVRAWIEGAASAKLAGAGRSSLPTTPGPPAASAEQSESYLHILPELAGDAAWPTSTPSTTEPGTAAPPPRGATAQPDTPSSSRAAGAGPATSTREDHRRRDREAARDARATASAEPKAPSPTPSSTARTPAPTAPPQVDVEIQPEGAEGDRRLVYTARLRDTTGQPMPDADVSLYAWMPDGRDVRTALSPTGTPGTYRGALGVGTSTPANPRLRINLAGRLFDIPISR